MTGGLTRQAPTIPGMQLSFETEPHPHARKDDGDPGILEGVVKISGDLPVRCDLNPGDQLTVTVANADGQVISIASAEVEKVGFVPIRVPDIGVVGSTRVHTAKAVYS